MRRTHPTTLALILTLSSCALAPALARADDRQAESQAAKQFSEPVPVKKFDLDKLDVTKMPVEPAPPKTAQTGKEAPKVKPMVRHRSIELVPEGAEIVLEIPDLARARRSASGSPLGRLMASDVLGPVWKRHIVDRLRNLPPSREGLPSGEALVELLARIDALVYGEAVIAAYPPTEGARGPRLLFVTEMEGAHRTAFLNSLEDLKTLAGLSRETSTENLSKDEFDYQRLTTKAGLTATWGFVGNQLVLEFGRGQQKAGKQLYADLVLPAAVSRGDKSLAREAARAEQIAVLGKDADFYLRADLKAMTDLAAADGAREMQSVAAGLQGVRYVAAALRFESGAARERIFLAMDQDSAFGKLLPKSAPGTELAKFMPLDACYFEVERMEPGVAEQSFETYKNSLPDRLRKQLEARISEIEKKSGLSMDGDILPAFAGEFASAYTLKTAGIAPTAEFVMVLQPQDLEKLRKVLAGLERALAGAGEFKSESYLGAQLHWLEKPKIEETAKAGQAAAGTAQPLAMFGGAQPGSGATAMPGLVLADLDAYAITGQYVVLGTSARIVKMAVRQRDPAQHTSNILDKADFKSARAALGLPANELSYGYLDLHRIGEVAYSLAGAAAQLAELPPADRVLEEVSGLAWSMRREKGGVSVEIHSPIGLFPLAAAFATKTGLDAVDAAEAAERTAHIGKLKAIWRGMELFSTEFGRYPLNLSELHPAYVANAAVFLTPDQESADSKPEIASAEELDTKTGYRYISGRAPNAVGTALLVYSAKPTARGTHWCLFANGTIREVPDRALPEMIGARRSSATNAATR